MTSQNCDQVNGDWPGWRGVIRDARVAWLPDSLPETANFEWAVELAGEGLGGIAAAMGHIVVGGRDAVDQNDVFQCFDINDGTLVWQHAYPALGKLDYGNSPRATPLIHQEYVYTLGAFGQLCCLEIETGIMMWQINIAREFDSPKLIRGALRIPAHCRQEVNSAAGRERGIHRGARLRNRGRSLEDRRDGSRVFITPAEVRG